MRTTSDRKPICYIIAGPNGAGKTTFAMRYLVELTGCSNFINADMIAQGLSPLDPAKSGVSAGKILLHTLRDKLERHEDFAFETTLSGRGYVRLLEEFRQGGWTIVLYFLWIPSADHSRDRVRERDEHGGHGIPDDVIYRRYPRTIRNLFELYAPLCDSVFIYDNSGPVAELVFSRTPSGVVMLDEALYRTMKECCP